MTRHAGTAPGTAAQAREQLLVEVFVLLADTLAEDYDVIDLMDRLVHTAVDALGVTAAGLLLDDQRGNLAMVASSSDEMQLLEAFQLQNHQGPCLECITGSRQVSCEDLRVEQDRWPLFVPAARAAGFLSVLALPLRLRSTTIGALNLFQGTVGALPEADARVAQALADMATIGILQRRSAYQSTELAEQLQHALNSRVVIEQAKGVLAERRSIGMDAAFDVLRRAARDHNHKLGELARRVVHEGLVLEDL